MGLGLPTARSIHPCHFKAPPKIDPEIDSDVDRLLEPESLPNRSKIHQKSIQKSMLFSIPFSDRFLIDFRSLQTLKMLIFHCRGAHFHEIAVSRKLSKNHQILIQKAPKIQSKIDQKSYQKLYQKIYRFFIDFWSKMPPKMEPQGVQEHGVAGHVGPPGGAKIVHGPLFSER